MLAFREAADDHALIPRGLAADSKLLFVADTAVDAIVVIDIATMESIRDFPAPRPGKLAIDRSGDLWAICDSGKRVAAYSAEGTPRLEKLATSAGSRGGWARVRPRRSAACVRQRAESAGPRI